MSYCTTYSTIVIFKLVVDVEPVHANQETAANSQYCRKRHNLITRQSPMPWKPTHPATQHKCDQNPANPTFAIHEACCSRLTTAAFAPRSPAACKLCSGSTAQCWLQSGQGQKWCAKTHPFTHAIKSFLPHVYITESCANERQSVNPT